MRIFITEKETDLEALASSLARTPRAAAAVRERVLALNPHLADAARIPKGSVLILPDSPEVKAGVGTSVSGASAGEIAERFSAGVRAQLGRAAARLESLTAERAAVRDALKSAAAKRLVESDPLLQKQLGAAEARFKEDQKRAAETQEQLDEVQKFALAEFEKLQKMLGQ
jgi:Phage Tail Protein X